MLSCMQDMQYTPGPQLCELLLMKGVDLVVQLSLSHFCACKSLLTRIPVCNPNKTHWFIKLDLGCISTLVYRGFPVWGEKTVVSPQEMFSHTIPSTL